MDARSIRAAALAGSLLFGADPGRAGVPPACNCTQGSGSGTGSGKTFSYGGSVSGAATSTSISTGVGISVRSAAGVSAATSAQALIQAAQGGSGAAGTLVESGGPSTSIESIKVEGGEARKVCTAWASEAPPMRLSAVCLDDRSAPRPALQVFPDRTVGERYEGEIYRCIAGARLQYTLYGAGGAGQSRTCSKGEALARVGGGLVCRPQTPARDRNERALLRRYGPGDKLVKVGGKGACVAWSGEPNVLN